MLEAFAKTAADPALPPVGADRLHRAARRFDGADSEDALTRGPELAWAISTAVRAIVGGWHGKPPRLWLVSRNGLPVTGAEPGDPAIGGLKGLVRILAYEHPDLHTTLVDLDGAGDGLASLITELERLATMT